MLNLQGISGLNLMVHSMNFKRLRLDMTKCSKLGSPQNKPQKVFYRGSVSVWPIKWLKMDLNGGTIQ